MLPFLTVIKCPFIDAVTKRVLLSGAAAEQWEPSRFLVAAQGC